MLEINRKNGDLPPKERRLLSAGFDRHSNKAGAPAYHKDELYWVSYDNDEALAGVLTADLLWDWLYVDELWVREDFRAQGLGKALLQEAEKYAQSEQLTGIWLWTQSWQAAGFYTGLGYEEFATFPDFPKGHSRIGFRKQL